MADNAFRFSIDQFTAEIGQRGIARPAHFYVMITPPPSLFNKSSGQYLPLRIESVNMPGRSLATFPRQIIGPPRQMPFAFTVTPLQINVILSEDMRERQFFLAWQDLLVGESRISGGQEVPNMYDIGYYDNAVGTMEILQYGETPHAQGRGQGDAETVGKQASDLAKALGFEPNIVTHPFGFNVFGITPKVGQINHATKTTVHELYPFTINDVDMDWKEGGYAKLTVEFRYLYYSEEHESIDASLAEDKGAFRRAVEGFGRFIPAATLLRNVGFNTAAKSVGRQFAGSADGLIGTLNAVDPF